MNKLDANQMLKGLNMMKKQANNLINQTLTSDLMDKMSDGQKQQVKDMRKQLRTLNQKGLNIDNEIFNKFK